MIVGQAVMLAKQEQKMFKFTLLPSSFEEHGNHEFYKFESLQPPLSRENAKQCLLPLNRWFASCT